MLAEAVRAHLDKDPAVVADLNRLRDEVVVRQWVASHSLVPKDYPSEADIDAAYKNLTARLSSSSDVRLGQIFVAMPEGADSANLTAAVAKLSEIQSKLAAGGNFADLAKRYSDHHESASKGGDLEFESESRLLPEIRAAVRTLKQDDKPVLVRSAQGFHIIRLLGKKSAAIPALQDVKPSLVNELRRARTEALEKQFVTDVSARAAPVINELEISRIVNEEAP
jgi:peptidylprolyl isomerase